MATPLYLGGWKCLTPISDEEAAHHQCLLWTSDRRAVVMPNCSILLPSERPPAEIASGRNNWMTAPLACTVEVSDSHVILP
jgi:hypothetical protein